MGIIGPVSLILMGGGFFFVVFGVARWTEGECRTILAAWAEEHGLTVLRCHRCFLIPSSSDSPSDVRVLYWLTVVDRGGLLRTGWASVHGRFWRAEFYARGIRARWVRVRAIPRPVSPAPGPSSGTLWDDWIDGGPGAGPG